jgi:Ca2+-binding EF-hand superfamily protein
MRVAAGPIGVILCVLAAMLSPPAAAIEPDAYFARIDRNGDGRISLAEFQDYMSRGFRSMDRNGDGILQDHELPAGVVLRPGQARTLSALLDNLERTFHAMDRNGDGYLSPAELLAPPPPR